MKTYYLFPELNSIYYSMLEVQQRVEDCRWDTKAYISRLGEFAERFGLTDHPSYKGAIEVYQEADKLSRFAEKEYDKTIKTVLSFLDELEDVAYQKKEAEYQKRMDKLSEGAETNKDLLKGLMDEASEAMKIGDIDSKDYILALIHAFISAELYCAYPLMAMLVSSDDWTNYKIDHKLAFRTILKSGIENGCFNNSQTPEYAWYAINTFNVATNSRSDYIPGDMAMEIAVRAITEAKDNRELRGQCIEDIGNLIESYMACSRNREDSPRKSFPIITKEIFEGIIDGYLEVVSNTGLKNIMEVMKQTECTTKYRDAVNKLNEVIDMLDSFAAENHLEMEQPYINIINGFHWSFEKDVSVNHSEYALWFNLIMLPDLLDLEDIIANREGIPAEEEIVSESELEELVNEFIKPDIYFSIELYSDTRDGYFPYGERRYALNELHEGKDIDMRDSNIIITCASPEKIEFRKGEKDYSLKLRSHIKFDEFKWNGDGDDSYYEAAFYKEPLEDKFVDFTQNLLDSKVKDRMQVLKDIELALKVLEIVHDDLDYDNSPSKIRRRLIVLKHHWL